VGKKIFSYLNSFQEPLRVPDLLAHLRSVDLPELSLPMAVGLTFPFLAAPVFHRGERFGNIFLAQREHGDEFTQEDEETLLTFASQVAMVMANARTHRDEQRARNDLETLINTSPVGVVVFDAKTGPRHRSTGRRRGS
jgi:GAF domain-containing protein